MFIMIPIVIEDTINWVVQELRKFIFKFQSKEILLSLKITFVLYSNYIFFIILAAEKLKTTSVSNAVTSYTLGLFLA